MSQTLEERSEYLAQLYEKREKAKKALKQAFGDVFEENSNILFVFYKKRMVRLYVSTETYQGAGLKGKGIENLIKEISPKV